jgi:hypothetical protein
MTGLADDPDAMFFNPAGLAFQPGISATANYVNWLPGLYQGMHYAYAAASYQVPKARTAKMDATVGLDVPFFTPAYADVTGELPPPYPLVWRGAIGASVSLRITPTVGVGAKVKYIRSYLVPEWVWRFIGDANRYCQLRRRLGLPCGLGRSSRPVLSSMN